MGNRLPLAPTTEFVELVQSDLGGPALCAKIFHFHSEANHLRIASHPVPEEGRWPSSRTLGRDAVDADALLTNSVDADGEVVWS